MFLPPRSHLIGQFIKRHLVTIRREQHVLAQWLRQYICQDHGVRSVDVGGKLFISFHAYQHWENIPALQTSKVALSWEAESALLNGVLT